MEGKDLMKCLDEPFTHPDGTACAYLDVSNPSITVACRALSVSFSSLWNPVKFSLSMKYFCNAT